MDDKGSLATYLGRDAVGFQPVEVEPGLFVMAMNTEDSLREYLRLFVRVPVIGSLAPLARIFEFVANAAPAVKEILAIGKICHEVREARHDVVIVDAEATGHVLGQLASPRTLENLVSLGMIRDQTRWMSEILENPATTSVAVVAVPEELAVTEAVELVGSLGGSTKVHTGALICNKMPAPALAPRESADSDLVARMDALASTVHGSAPLDDAIARFVRARDRRTEAEVHADRLRRAAGEAAFVVVGDRGTERADTVAAVAEALAEEGL